MGNPTIGIIDCGSGNLRSVSKAIQRQGGLPEVSGDVDDSWDGLVLPGVGAFGHVMNSVDPVKADLLGFVDRGKPFLGICLGLQVLFESSEENPGLPGLGLMKGEVARIEAEKVPHMGWNSLEIPRPTRFLRGIGRDDYFYFVHSYAALPEEEVTTATCEYEGRSITAVVERDNIQACQFHPEKSGALGLRIIRNFIEIAGDGP
jgi:glutamine amidotransferase